MKSYLMAVVLTGTLIALTVAQPSDNKKPLTRIAFGSCMNQDRDQGIWNPLVKSRPELFLFLGDNIYADTEDPKELRETYDKLAKQPGYKKLQARCPILAIWDDHDYGLNDSGSNHPRRKESQQAFLDFFGIAKDSPRRKQEGVYHSAVIGPVGKRVQIILLDTRYHRSPLKSDPKRPRNLGQYVPNTDPDATMLGEAQWKWLEAQLKIPAELRLIGTSVQFVAEEHGFEKWANIPRERQRLLQLLRNTRAEGVVLLSGDRHLAELSMMDGEIGYPLYDLTSSGMNMANKRFRKLEPNKYRVGIMDVGNNFGMVRIDWEREDPLVQLEIYDEDGDVTIRQKLPLSRLRIRKSKKAKNSGENLAAEAKKLVGKEWTVEMHVRATGSNRMKTMIFLNSEKDFRSEENFTVVLDMKSLAEDLMKAKISDPAKHFAGKAIKVKGTVSEFRGSPQIQVRKLEQITIVE